MPYRDDPTPAHIMDDPDHWRRRAKEVRALAEESRDRQMQALMFRVAADYDGLALRAEERISLMKNRVER
jgi:hypothetical protein